MPPTFVNVGETLITTGYRNLQMQNVLALWQGRTGAKEMKNSMFLPFSKLSEIKIWTATGKCTLCQKDWEINIFSFKTNRILSSLLQYLPLVLGKTWKLMVEVQNQTFQGCFDRLRLERSQENPSYARVFGFSYQPQRHIHTIKFVGYEIMLHSNTSSRENIKRKKKVYLLQKYIL